MSEESEKTRSKDIWDKFQIIVQVFIAVIALSFTVLFGVKQQKNTEATTQLAASNLELAKAQKKISEEQLKSALLPSLCSENPKQRAMAMYLAEALDESFATVVAGTLALNDPNQNVRRSARLTLGSLSKSKQEGIKQQAQDVINQYDIVNELRNKGLLKKLSDAQGYLEGGNIQDKEKALQIYREVVKQLAPSLRSKMDQKLLDDAEMSYKEGHNDDAIRNYRALFAGYSQISFSE